MFNAFAGAVASVVVLGGILYSDAWGLRDLLAAGADGAVVLLVIAIQAAALLGGGMAATSVLLLGDD